jgi:hypothetical protein
MRSRGFFYRRDLRFQLAFPLSQAFLLGSLHLQAEIGHAARHRGDQLKRLARSYHSGLPLLIATRIATCSVRASLAIRYAD